MKKIMLLFNLALALIGPSSLTLAEINLDEPTATDPNLFQQVKANLEDAINETNFWLRQVKEHALFLNLGLVDSKLKQRAKDLHKKFQNYESKYKNPRISELNSLLPLLKELRDFQLTIIERQKSGEWSWLFPSLVKHMIMEGDYFVDKLNAVPYSAEDEIAFWKKEASDRIGVIAHLLDPSEKQLVAQATKISDNYFNVPADQKKKFNKSALQAIKAVNEFSEGLDLANVESIINKTLAEHEAREGQRGAEILQNFGAN